MSKAKVASRRPVLPPADDAVELPSRWQGRPWMPLLISAIVIAAILASGLAISDVLKAPRPSALAACITSTQIANHTFIGPQPICIVPSKTYQATVNTTKGPITIQLYPQVAPVTVNNFIVLALNGYYNNMPWKSETWVVQNGDPNGDGRGGPGYSLPNEPNTNPPWGLGAVGMARPIGGPVNGSQFFIQRATWPGTGPTTVYNRFGTVIQGLGNVELLTAPSDRITSITIQVG
ncbi:MAG TPA: peptidylprolyl isomerase [Candidatus Dormibacteraeota bacterium]